MTDARASASLRLVILTSVVLTFVTLAAAAQAQLPAPSPASGVRVNSVLRQDGNLQIWEIGQDRLAALPQSASAGSIPLTGAQAIDVARAWLSRQAPAAKGWTAVTTTLRRFGTEGPGAAPPNGWFYAVLLEPDNRGSVAPAVAFSDAGRFWVVVLLDGSVVEPTIVDVSKPATQLSTASSSTQGPTEVYTVGPGTGVTPPRLIAAPKPRYTADAMRARIEGRVRLRCVVNTDGVCEDIRVAESLDTVYGLDAEAIHAARQWRFAPGTRGGQPVKVGIIIELSFNVASRK